MDEQQRSRSDMTRIAHAGEESVESATSPLVAPIYQTAVYSYPDLETVDDVYERRRPGYIYGRYGLPNHTLLERALADLERAEAAVATASGMGAITSLLFTLLSAGDRVVASDQVYRGTRNLLDHDLARLGVEVSYVDARDLVAVREALARPANLLYVDAITNPTIRVHNLPALAALAHEVGALFVVDGTFTTPYHCRPLALGADVVVHSTTKFIAGHNDVSGGVVLGQRELIDDVRRQAVRFGAVGGPFDAWLVLRGLKTLAVRLWQSSENALTLARLLEQHPAVARVWYPGLPSHPEHELASMLLSHGYGSMLAVDVRGGRAAVERFVRQLELVAFAETLGGLGTTVVHPATTSHRSDWPDVREELGVGEGLLRFSVGIEDPADLAAEILRALDATLGEAPRRG